MTILGLGIAGALAAGAVTPALDAQTAGRSSRVELRSLVPGGRLGVTIRDVTAADVEKARLSGVAGAYVQNVGQGTPAADAGFQAGDIVLMFDGERVRSVAQLTRLVDETPAGRAVEVTVQRSGAPVTLTVTPERSPRDRVFSWQPSVPGLDIQPFTMPELPGLTAPNTGRLGVTVQPLSDQLGEYFGASAGVLVTSVRADSPAATAGIRAGDVITRVGDETVDDVAGLRRLVGRASGEIAVGIVRERQARTVTVTFDPAPDSRGMPL